jgi:eukaryotic-like serine/threonine-protein kinase
MERSERPSISDSIGSDPSGAEAVPPQIPLATSPGRTADEAGRFRVLTLHASGGMGNVFVAKDDQLNRSVALKEIQERFADDPQIRERFVREAEVTGQLEHPGIVPVYALGHYADGRPYYVMRMIRGDSLKHAIAALHRNRANEHAYHLELRRLLNRFITACNTIEYAHSRGVVHRDIKPDNILLGPYGETLVVDWGLAKLVQSSPASSTVSNAVQIDVPGGDDRLPPSSMDATQAGTITGTPSYMSPEQALGWQDAIKPASDIYSLGATLYTLLTGRVPIGGDDLGDLLVRIQKQDFRKPRELNSSIPRPLEAICLKAMARSMSTRYGTAAELAADIEAFLADEPVSAWKEPATVRAARWVRRHRTLVSTGGATAAVLLLSLAIIVVLQGSANRRLTVANDREKSARKEAESERDKAQQNFQMAQDAVDKYFTQVSEDRRLAAHGLEPLRRDLLNSAGQFYERLVAKDASKAALRYDSAWAKFRIASITDEIASPAEAARKFEIAAQSFRDLAKSEGGTSPRSREGVLFCQYNLWSLYDRTGQRAKARQSLADAIALARSLVSDFPESSTGQHFLARCFGAQGQMSLEEGNLAAADAADRDEIRLREQLVQAQSAGVSPTRRRTFEVELAEAYRNLAVVQQQYEHLDDARNLLDKSLAIERRLVRDNPDDGYSQHMLARTLTHVGELAARSARGDDAEKAYREAVDLRVALVQKHPDVLEYRAALETTADNFGVFCSDRGEYDLAQKYYEHALQQAERLAGDYPQQPDYQSSLATALVNAAMLCEIRGRLALAEQWLTRAFQIRATLQHAAPNDPNVEEQLASASMALGTVETDTKHGKQAEKHLQSAITVFRRLSTAHQDRPFFADRLAACLKLLADLLKSEQRNDQAIAAYQDAQQLLRKLVAAHPAVLQHRVELAGTCINLGNLRNRLNQPALAFTAFDEAIRSFPEATRSKLDAGARSHLEKAFTGRGLAHEAQGDLKGMASDFEMAASLAPSGRARILRLMCVSSLADGKQLDRAVAVAEPLVGDAGLEGPPAFDLANLYIRAAIAAKADHQKPEKDRAALAEQRIQHGLWLLQRAFGAGFFGDPSHRNKLQNSPFVPLLATNAAFRKLVEAVEKGPPAKPQAPAK